MTFVGKILVFFVLLLSLVLGGLIVADYTTRTHWAAGVKDRDDKIQVLTASLRAYQAEAENTATAANARIAELNGQLKKVRDDLADEKKVTAGLYDELAQAKNLTARSDAVQGSATVEIQKSRADLDQMRATLQAEINRNNELVKAANQSRDEKVAAQIALEAVKGTNVRLEAQLRQMAEDVAKLKAGPTGGSALAQNAKNPPPENVEGLIERVDRGGLMQLSIGSDAGLAKGQTLDAFRLGPAASQSRYLGSVRIVEVTPNSAVAEPVRRMSDTPKPGDRVASTLR
jgi:hypothetical protein